ncbi:MAG: ABC transporter permease [Cytophagales bacterium]|nr:ABC transporter permease [Cytophagales bacterium]
MNNSNSTEFDLVIKPGAVEKNYWQDIWRFRELFYILTWRDLKVRYKQTVLGVAWSVLRPLLSTIIFSVLFGRIARLGSEVPQQFYLVFVFAAMLPWQFFSNALAESSNSIVQNSNLITKIYFPRIIVPASTVIVSLVDFMISFVLLLGMFVIYGLTPSWKMIFLPGFLLMAFLAAFGIGLLLTAVNVKYRDFRFVMPFIIQFGMFLSPVAYSSLVVQQNFGIEARMLYSINPLVGVIDGFRWAIFGQDNILFLPGLLISAGVTFIMLWVGVRYFRRTEKGFADTI